MLVAPALLLGTLFGIVSVLVPGLSLALTISIAVGVGFGGVAGAVFIASASGAALFTKRLALVMHPNANTGVLASLGPVMKMVAQGEGQLALDLMVYTTCQAYKVMAAAGVALVALSACVMNLNDLLKAWLGALGLVLIPLWIIATCYRSKHPYRTLVGFMLTGLFGWWVMHNPMLMGNENSMSVILVSLFGIPMCKLALKHANGYPMALQVPTRWLDIQKKHTYAGIGIGALAGLLPGLGASSLVSMLFTFNLEEETMLLLASAAESANDITAVILLLTTGMTRSGEAVMLKSCLNEPNIWALTLTVLAVAFGSYWGYRFVKECNYKYSNYICQYKQTQVLWVVLALSLVPVGLSGGLSITGQLSAWIGLIVGLIIASWCHKWYLPNQVAFGALTIPIMINDWGLGGYLNLLLSLSL